MRSPCSRRPLAEWWDTHHGSVACCSPSQGMHGVLTGCANCRSFSTGRCCLRCLQVLSAAGAWLHLCCLAQPCCCCCRRGCCSGTPRQQQHQRQGRQPLTAPMRMWHARYMVSPEKAAQSSFMSAFHSHVCGPTCGRRRVRRFCRCSTSKSSLIATGIASL